MTCCGTDNPDLRVIEQEVFTDERGFFVESWNRCTFETDGLDVQFVQDNHSRSRHGVLRGLHYQVSRPQGKLVRVSRGKVFDVAVDLRRSSPHFGCWTGITLSDDDGRSFWIPPGFAHGFLVLSDTVDFLYKCTEYYSPDNERTLLWNDPDIGIEWPLAECPEPVISAKDAAGMFLSEAEVYQ